MRPVTCIITDDEPFARKGLERYVQQVGFLDLKGQCEDAAELSEMLDTQPVDLLFLDIQMPHMNGVDLVRSLANPPKVIFTTAFKEYAIEGFELDVIDYLLKPISFDRFLKASNKAKEYFEQAGAGTETNYLFVRAEGKLEKIDFDKLLYVEGMENYIAIFTAGGRVIVHSTIKDFLNKLPKHKFIQTHRSYIAAIDKIKTIDGNTLYIGNGQVPISRALRDSVLDTILK